MKKKMMTLAVVLSCALTTSVFTACSIEDNFLPDPVIITDDKPFSYDKYIDNTVRPGDDFFRYQYGAWLADGTLPSMSNEVTSNLSKAKSLVFNNSNDPVVSTIRQLVQDTTANDKDMLLVSTRIAYVSNIKTQQDLLEAFTTLHQIGYKPVVRQMTIGSERVLRPLFICEKPSEYLKQAFQLKDSAMLAESVDNVCRRLSAFGFSKERIEEISKNALSVEQIEMRAFENPLNMIRKMQDPDNRISYRRAASPATKQVCELMGIGDLSDLMMENPDPDYEKAVQELIAMLLEGSEQSVAQLRDYMIAYIVGADLPFLPQLSPNLTDDIRMEVALGYAKYYMYRLQVETFGKENIYKEQCMQMMEDFRSILIERIGNLEWMGDATKQAAQKKAKMMDFFIGYPDQWNDELTPHIEASSLLEAVDALRQHEAALYHQMVGKTTAVAGWDLWCSLFPFTLYNAFYDATNNQLIIMPAFLIAPLFDPTQSEATLYGTAYVFGHEMCHGFDAGGSGHDEMGCKRDWWTPADKAAFEAKQQQLITLWEQLEHYPGQPANGTFTLKENMADYGGATLALEAYTRQLRQQGFSGEQIDEQIQKFWLSYGMPVALDPSERSVDRLKQSYLTDVHSAGHNRVNGIARLFDDWYRLYDVKPTDKLYVAPENRVKIW